MVRMKQSLIAGGGFDRLHVVNEPVLDPGLPIHPWFPEIRGAYRSPGADWVKSGTVSWKTVPQLPAPPLSVAL